MEDNNINQELLIKFIFRKTNEAEEEKIKDWLNADISRYEILEKYMRSKALLLNQNDAEWKTKDYLDIRRKIQKKQTRRLFLKIAAAFIGLMLCGTLTFLLFNTEGDKWEMVTVEKGTQQQIVLDDGTKVWLAPDTKLYYPHKFDSDKREVRLEGQGYFDVEHDKDWPFVVYTKYSDIKVLGTTFNVKAYPDDYYTTTVLVDGLVNLEFKDDESEILENQLLHPSQKCIYNHQTLIHDVHTVDLRHELAWRENRLSFRNETFGDIATKIERHYNVEVMFNNHQLSKKRLTGEFKDESLPQVLETLQEWSSFSFTIKDSVVIIEK
ncbi:DUF4974 domain-containing protein [Carboxylicivirga mesophila]|uniref:DUF4974 domain-containing protein n=1 Tax=Carboxylicivirga mesophila TaxID=1166478 RepID=A0ABS5K6F1_9BACT|nr:FecR domain-containing protein [Carboxylicivirga mesophila]MBS2209943.1 DUF4974 domain-containing protein [Carboxylicivirga mesophila]